MDESSKNNFHSMVKRSASVVLSFILFSVTSVACVLLYRNDARSLIYFGDAVSHIVRARQFIDSQQPGIVNIGTVWLPLPHCILIPFVSFDALFYTGIAGAIVGIPLLIITVILLFSTIRLLADSSSIAFFIALLFGLNPNIIYIALTPMSEISLLFFVTLGGFALLKWIRSEQEPWLVLCAVAVLCATLCRYEAWLLAPFVTVCAVYGGMVSKKQGNHRFIFSMVLISGISWLGIVFWFTWNYVLYGDALKFAHWTYSVGTSAVRTTLSDHPRDLFVIIVNALLWIFGPLMLGAGLLSLFSMKRLSVRKEQIVMLLYFSLPAFFVIAAILIGFVQVDQWWWNWRFVLTFGLFFSVASALALQELFQKYRSPILRAVVILCFGVIPAVQISVPSVGVAVYNDAKKSFDDRSRTAAALGEEIQKRYEGGSIALLTGYGVGQRIMISSGLPLRSFNVKYFSDDTTISVLDRYIIIGKDSSQESPEFSRYWDANKSVMLRTYAVSMENNFFVLLELKK